ncbi:hypothetical protein ACF0H5_005514 [Mactra antiquata]
MFYSERISILCIIFITLASADIAAAIDKPDGSSCHKQETFFKHNAIYTYDYTVTTSHGFIGVSSSMSGGQLSCTVTLKVPKRCEMILQLSDCSLQERSIGSNDEYSTVENSDSFIQDLERYSMYFQMNEGLVLPDTIIADDDETLAVLNIKRGILSELQFQILGPDQFTDDVEETDIFGLCHTKYTFSSREPNTIHTFKNLRQCEMPQIFRRQFNSPFAAVKPLLGGTQEGTISEFIYPFVSEVSCDYKLNDQKRLAKAECLQMQYFKPTANKGDVLATVMANVSQTLKLSNYQKKSQKRPDLSLNGRSVIGIKYTYAADLHSESSASQIVNAATKLVEVFNPSKSGVDLSLSTHEFEQLLYAVRQAPEDELQKAMTDIFECGENCNTFKGETMQYVYLDALKVCGTDACLISYIRCLDKGHVTTMNGNHFLMSIANLKIISENVLAELYAYCKKTEKTLCWLTLGSYFGHNYVEDEKEDSVLFGLQDEMSSRVIINCDGDSLVNTERELNTAIKTMNNIGMKQNSRFMLKRPGLNIGAKLQTCLLKKHVPPAIKRSILRSFKLVQEFREYKDTPTNTIETLFALLVDPTEDISVRTQSFSQLLKTTVEDDIIRLVNYMKEPNTKQLLSYMHSAVDSLLEDDSLEMKDVKASWQEVNRRHYFTYDFRYGNEFLPTKSKSIRIADFFKFPISDIMGGQMIVDLVYTPASSYLFSSYSIAFNYYYGNQKYNLYELDINLHGFSLLLDVLLKRVDMTLNDLYDLYNELKARAEGQGKMDDDILSAKFQQNIVKAIDSILKIVNHPVELDFDFSVDLILQGQEVMFLSLQEIIDHVMEMQEKLPPNKSMFQTYLQKLMAGIDFNLYRFTEMLFIDRGIPTCAGLPLNMTVSWTGKALTPLSIKSNVALFMAGKTGQLTSNIRQYLLFAHHLSGSMVVPFGDVYTSGIKSNIDVGFERGAAVTLRYGYSDPLVLVENPTKKKFQFELFPILPEQESESLFYARGSMFLIHNSVEEMLPADNQVSTMKCMADSKTSMMIGRSLCIFTNFPRSVPSKPYFPMSGPFDIRLEFTKLFGVQSYESTWEYSMEKEPYSGYTYQLNFEHYAKGEGLSRYAFMTYKFEPELNKLTINAGYPDGGLSYEAEYSKMGFGVITHEWIKYRDYVLSGYSLKVTPDMFLLNYTDVSIGWELHMQHKDMSDVQISYSYFCTMDHPLLYLFHPVPVLAAENGDKTQVRISFKDKSPAKDQFAVSFGIYD